MKTMTVLVVDDDVGTRCGLHKLLKLEGFQVRTAADAVDALEFVRRRCPDIVLTDLKMPAMDGVDLCAALRRAQPLLPVIVITAASDVSSAVRAMQAGATDYLIKPLDIDALLACIQRAVDARATQLGQERVRHLADTNHREMLRAKRAYEETTTIVSHDLAMPLHVIQSAVEVLGRHSKVLGTDKDDLRRLAKCIMQASDRMSQLVSDLLDTSRVRSGHLELSRAFLHTSDLMEDVRALRPVAWQRGVRLHIEQPSLDPVLYVDRERVAQVFSNLVANAVHFSAMGATVLVSAEDLGREVCFRVRDEGPGIAPERLATLFERHRRLHDDERGGLGVGLHIAKGIVEAHGGRIAVESEVGRGTVVTVILPKSFADDERPSGSWKLV